MSSLCEASHFLQLYVKTTVGSLVDHISRVRLIPQSAFSLLRTCSSVNFLVSSHQHSTQEPPTLNPSESDTQDERFSRLLDPEPFCQKRRLHAKSTDASSDSSKDIMLPFPFQRSGASPHTYFGQQMNAQLMQSMNVLNQFPAQGQFPEQLMFLSQHPAAIPSLLQMEPDAHAYFKGNVPWRPMGQQGRNQFSPRHSQARSPQGYNQDNRQKNRLKRKSDELGMDRRNPHYKMGRYQGQGHGQTPPNSSRSSFLSSATSMHAALIKGAKPILHVPGEPCERITEAIVHYYNEFHQSEDDLRHKIVLSNCLFAIVKGIFPGCRLFIVGSSLSGFGTRTSDMDLCLLVTQIQAIDQKSEAVHILNAIHKSLRKCTFVKSSQVIKAKVPILKFTDSLKNIECDLNINNGVGIRNTHLLKYYCLADARVAPLMLFVKQWARYHNINDAHKRTISSYSLAMMLIHYLQVCTPPVLPCLQKLYPDRFNRNTDLRELRLDEPLENLVSKNTESLGSLFQGFLDYYAFNFRPEMDVISVREGCVLSRQMVQNNSMEPMQWKCLCIEEPFDQSNTARSVFDHLVFQRVHSVFVRSAQTLRRRGDVKHILSQPF